MSDSNPDKETVDSGSGGGRRSKVQRIIEERGFEGLGAELERRWTTDGPEQMSLRELADLFNRRVLADEIAASEMQVVEGEVENFYMKLTDDDVGSETRVEVERRLRREGIDIDTVSDDFVTHQSIHTYLRQFRGASVDTPTPETRLDNASETINRLLGRVRNVVSNTLQTLDNTGAISLGDTDVFVTVNVVCNDCGSRMEVNELLEEGGCDCNE